MGGQLEFPRPDRVSLPFPLSVYEKVKENMTYLGTFDFSTAVVKEDQPKVYTFEPPEEYTYDVYWDEKTRVAGDLLFVRYDKNNTDTYDQVFILNNDPGSGRYTNLWNDEPSSVSYSYHYGKRKNYDVVNYIFIVNDLNKQNFREIKELQEKRWPRTF